MENRGKVVEAVALFICILIAWCVYAYIKVAYVIRSYFKRASYYHKHKKDFESGTLMRRPPE